MRYSVEIPSSGLDCAQVPRPDYAKNGVTERQFGPRPTNVAIINDRYDARAYLLQAQVRDFFFFLFH